MNGVGRASYLVREVVRQVGRTHNVGSFVNRISLFAASLNVLNRVEAKALKLEDFLESL